MSEINSAVPDLDEVGRKLKIPAFLAKALYDPFDYALGLRDGTVIRFNQARMDEGDEWVHLTIGGGWADHGMTGQTYTFDRGLYVRVNDIMWVADAPMGS